MMCSLICRPPCMSSVSELTRVIFSSNTNFVYFHLNKMGTLHVEHKQGFGPLEIEDFLDKMAVQVKMLLLLRYGVWVFDREFIPS